ncbi:MAG TPA: NUDIX hydrolase [Hyphomicrobiaceae bacterium]|nr:NUDIX hydrolase [Hyphomicrobiaceae bacterium]
MPPPKTPLLTVDCVVLNPRGEVLLIQRKNEPFKGHFALPGGFVDIGETVEDACRRELLEETGVKAGRLKLVGVYSDPNRDPRGHTASVVFLTRVSSTKLEAGDDAASAQWVANWRRLPLAFDHAKILADATRMAKS